MKLVLRILAAPVAGVLLLAAAFFSFALAVSGAILGIASVIVFILAVITFFVNTPAMGVAWMAVAFLISPFGLPRLAGWLVEKLTDINGALRDFIFG
jgi:hypothetical protein